MKPSGHQNHVTNPIQKPFLETTKWNLSWKFHTLSSRPYLSLSRFKCEVKDMHHGLHLAISFGPHVLHLLTFTGPISFEVLPTRESIRIISYSIISFFYYLSSTDRTTRNNTNLRMLSLVESWLMEAPFMGLMMSNFDYIKPSN